MLKNASNGCSTLQLETLELLPHMMEGALRECPCTCLQRNLKLTPITQSTLGSNRQSMDRCRASYHLLIILAENPCQLILLIEGIISLQMENAMLHGVQGVWLFHTCDTLAEVLSRETS
jgi:hypothetical protein